MKNNFVWSSIELFETENIGVDIVCYSLRNALFENVSKLEPSKKEKSWEELLVVDISLHCSKMDTDTICIFDVLIVEWTPNRRKMTHSRSHLLKIEAEIDGNCYECS